MGWRWQQTARACSLRCYLPRRPRRRRSGKDRWIVCMHAFVCWFVCLFGILVGCMSVVLRNRLRMRRRRLWGWGHDGCLVEAACTLEHLCLRTTPVTRRTISSQHPGATLHFVDDRLDTHKAILAHPELSHCRLYLVGALLCCAVHAEMGLHVSCVQFVL